MKAARRRPVVAIALAGALYLGAAPISPTAWAQVHSGGDNLAWAGVSVGPEADRWPARTGEPEPAAAPADPNGELPAWPFAVGAVAAVAVVAIWSVRRRP